MLFSIAASSSGHWNHDASRAWQRAIRPSTTRTHTSTSPRNASVMAMPSLANSAGRSPTRVGPGGRLASQPLSRTMLCSISRMRTQTRASTSPLVKTGTAKAAHVWRVGKVAAGIEVAARGAADVAAGRPLFDQVLADDAGVAGAILQRRRVVIEPHHFGERLFDLVEHDLQAPRRAGAGPLGAARDDAVHHQAVAERAVRRRQHALAEDAAMGVDERERRIVADRADVAQMIGDALKLGHHCRAGLWRAVAGRPANASSTARANAKL